MNEISQTTSKKCAKCKEEKLLSEFRNCKKGKYGVHGYCKICQDLKSKISYEKNKDKRLKQILDWTNKNSDKTKIYKKTWYQGKKDVKI